MKSADLVVMVRCLHCRHRSTLSPGALAAFGLPPDAPIAAFVNDSSAVNAEAAPSWQIELQTTKLPPVDCARDARAPPFPAPWIVEERPACFIVKDAKGQELAFV